MRQWKIKERLGHQTDEMTTIAIKINREIFQGDGLSPCAKISSKEVNRTQQVN